MEHRKLLTLLALSIGWTKAGDLKPQTVTAWDQYIASVRAQMEARLHAPACFLWADEQSDRMKHLKAGEVLVASAEEQNPRRIPGGLIHHWIGAAFIPGVTLKEVFKTVQDYDRYKEYYPNILASRLVTRNAETDQFASLERHQAMFSRIGLDADFKAVYTLVSPTRGYSFSEATRLQQIENLGNAGQHELADGSGKAYLWRLDSMSRYEERDGGVYLELEAFALSREIPAAFHWLVVPFIRDAAAGALNAMMQQTRQAVLGVETAKAAKAPAGATSFRLR